LTFNEGYAKIKSMEEEKKMNLIQLFFRLRHLIFVFFILFFINYSLEGKIYSVNVNAREKLFLTIYSFNLGLVREIRTITIPKGDVILKFEDIPSKIDPTTISLKSLTSPKSLKFIEQKYEYDLLNTEKLLEKYVGREVILVSIDPKTKEEKREKAILLSISGGKIFKIGDRILIDFPGRIEFPKLPKDLLLKPLLSWKVKNNYTKQQKLEMSYLTEGLNWKAYYNAIVKEEDEMMDLTALINIDNKSGVDFKRANVKLVAGEIQKLKRERVMMKRPPVFTPKTLALETEAEEFFEYHIYSLPYPITLKNNQTKQLIFFKTEKVPIVKKYILKGQKYYYTSRYDIERKEKIDVYLHIENKKKKNLGLALPKGVFRVYNEDKNGYFQFIGEDQVKHTPEGETIKLRIGKAFDILAIRRQIDYEKISNKIHESSFEITINNYKKRDIKVDVIEPVHGEWEIIKSNYPYEKIDIYNLKFIIPVKKKSHSVLKYTIRIKY